jgi:hypothetical protein
VRRVWRSEGFGQWNFSRRAGSRSKLRENSAWTGGRFGGGVPLSRKVDDEDFLQSQRRDGPRSSMRKEDNTWRRGFSRERALAVSRPICGRVDAWPS